MEGDWWGSGGWERVSLVAVVGEAFDSIGILPFWWGGMVVVTC